MNRFTRVIACSVLVSAPLLVFAQGNSEGMHRGGMMDREQMQRMHESMSEMQEIRQRIHDTNPGDERERLRGQHMEHMHQHMDMMRGGMTGRGQGMMDNSRGMGGDQDGKKSGKSRQKASGNADIDVERRMELMEERMVQMQLMMEQMLEYMDNGRRQSR